MRKLLLITMVMLSLQGFSQKYRISGFYAEDGFENWDYNYADNTGTHMVSVNMTTFFDGKEGEYIDSLFYDDRGNIIELATWQKVEGEFIRSCYIVYEYNEQNLRTRRENLFDDPTYTGGVYTYTYDENGKMIGYELSFMNVEVYQKGIIEYNEEGLKASETIMQYNFSTYGLEYTSLIENKYDDKGNLERVDEYAYDLASLTWIPQLIRVNEYDEYNNCIMEEVRSASGRVEERTNYTYDLSVSIEDVYHYENPERDYPILPQMKNMVKSYEYYAENDNGDLVYVTDYVFDYEIYDTEAVEEVAFSTSIYPNPAQDFVMIESEANYVEVVDVYGRVMFATEMTDMLKVDMSDFATGIYFVKLHNNGATSVQKIMKD